MNIKNLLIPVTIAVAMGYGSVALAVNNNDPVKRALGHIKSHGLAVEKSPGDQFFVRDVIIDADGSEHVRFDRTYKGLSVIGGDVVVHSNGKGSFSSASHTLQHVIDVDTAANVDESDAIDLAEMEFDPTGARNAPTLSKLVVFAHNEEPVLAWDVKVLGVRNDGTPAEAHYIIDAIAPKIIDQWDDIETSAFQGTGKSFSTERCSHG